MKDYLKIARFDHWIKQLFILPGTAFALLLAEPGDRLSGAALVLPLVLALAATCLIASANYVINEWLDAEFDRFHPTKKQRPVVTRDLSGKVIVLMYVLFAACGLLVAFAVSIPVFVTCAVLLLMGILYNVKPLRLKDVPYLDVLSESVNNALRLVIGWLCVAPFVLPPSSIVIGYWMGGAFLMGVKRFSEYRMIGDGERAASYRKSFAWYNEKRLLISSFFYAMLSVFFTGVFMIKYRIELLILIPFLCGLFCVYLNISYKADSSAQKPEKLYREKGLMLYVIGFIVLFAILMFLRIPALDWFVENTFIDIK